MFWNTMSIKILYLPKTNFWLRPWLSSHLLPVQNMIEHRHIQTHLRVRRHRKRRTTSTLSRNMNDELHLPVRLNVDSAVAFSSPSSWTFSDWSVVLSTWLFHPRKKVSSFWYTVVAGRLECTQYSGNMPDCGVRGPRFESHRGQLQVFRKKLLRYTAAHPYCSA